MEDYDVKPGMIVVRTRQNDTAEIGTQAKVVARYRDEGVDAWNILVLKGRSATNFWYPRNFEPAKLEVVEEV